MLNCAVGMNNKNMLLGRTGADCSIVDSELLYMKFEAARMQCRDRIRKTSD